MESSIAVFLLRQSACELLPTIAQILHWGMSFRRAQSRPLPPSPAVGAASTVHLPQQFGAAGSSTDKFSTSFSRSFKLPPQFTSPHSWQELASCLPLEKCCYG